MDIILHIMSQSISLLQANPQSQLELISWLRRSFFSPHSGQKQNFFCTASKAQVFEFE